MLTYTIYNSQMLIFSKFTFPKGKVNLVINWGFFHFIFCRKNFEIYLCFIIEECKWHFVFHWQFRRVKYRCFKTNTVWYFLTINFKKRVFKILHKTLKTLLLTLMRRVFLKVVFSGGDQIAPFIYHEHLL